MSWTTELVLDPAGPRPLSLQVAEAIVDAIRCGRLDAGARLPGSRRLARALGVHRNTVVAAFEELTAQGWVEARTGSGTYVARDLPRADPGSVPATAPRVPAYALPPVHAPRIARPPTPGVLHLAGGRPDPRLLPTADIARAWRRVVRRRGVVVLDYGDPRGHPRLRAALREMLAATRGVVAGPDEILVTRGAQMAIHLVARALLRPGDRVAVEAYGYPPAWAALGQEGVELVDVRVDDRGLDVDALAAAGPLRAVYATPHHQFPTLAVLGASRRLRLLELARDRGLFVLEDDYDHEFHYEGRPVLPLAARDRRDRSVVVYVGTLSKVLAPGLRIGFVVASPEVIKRLVALRIGIDRQGDLAMDCAIAELLEDGLVQRHMRRMRRVYAARREALALALRRELGGALSFELPSGGMALWARIDAPGVSARAWAERGLAAGVAFAPGGAYRRDGADVSWLRLGFAGLDEAEIEEAVRRMAASLGMD